MTIQTKQNTNKEGGFTLVELAIVMIIIGLLIGGILKGQELIGNAQTASTIAEIKGLDASTSTFRDKYAALPGDMQNADARLRDCTANCIGPGNGDGRLASNPQAVVARPSEAFSVFQHLAAADLISGVELNGAATFGTGMPDAPLGGGYRMGYTNTGGIGGVGTGRRGHYLAVSLRNVALTGATTDGVNATQAGQIDRKLDDGRPTTGDVLSNGTGCRAGVLYDEANENSSCEVYVRIQG